MQNLIVLQGKHQPLLSVSLLLKVVHTKWCQVLRLQLQHIWSRISSPGRQRLQSRPWRLGRHTHCPVVLSQTEPGTVPLWSQVHGAQPRDHSSDWAQMEKKISKKKRNKCFQMFPQGSQRSSKAGLDYLNHKGSKYFTEFPGWHLLWNDSKNKKLLIKYWRLD